MVKRAFFGFDLYKQEDGLLHKDTGEAEVPEKAA